MGFPVLSVNLLRLGLWRGVGSDVERYVLALWSYPSANMASGFVNLHLSWCMGDVWQKELCEVPLSALTPSCIHMWLGVLLKQGKWVLIQLKGFLSPKHLCNEVWGEAPCLQAPL